MRMKIKDDNNQKNLPKSLWQISQYQNESNEYIFDYISLFGQANIWPKDTKANCESQSQEVIVGLGKEMKEALSIVNDIKKINKKTKILLTLLADNLPAGWECFSTKANAKSLSDSINNIFITYKGLDGVTIDTEYSLCGAVQRGFDLNCYNSYSTKYVLEQLENVGSPINTVVYPGSGLNVTFNIDINTNINAKKYLKAAWTAEYKDIDKLQRYVSNLSNNMDFKDPEIYIGISQDSRSDIKDYIHNNNYNLVTWFLNTDTKTVSWFDKDIYKYFYKGNLVNNAKAMPKIGEFKGDSKPNEPSRPCECSLKGCINKNCSKCRNNTSGPCIVTSTKPLIQKGDSFVLDPNGSFNYYGNCYDYLKGTKTCPEYTTDCCTSNSKADFTCDKGQICERGPTINCCANCKPDSSGEPTSGPCMFYKAFHKNPIGSCIPALRFGIGDYKCPIGSKLCCSPT